MPDPEAGPQHLQESNPAPPRPPAEKPRCVSLTAGLSRLLSIGFHLPLRSRPQDRKARSVSDTGLLANLQGAAEPHKGPHSLRPSDDILVAGSDLDQENAHFVVVDMVLEAIEEGKWAACGRRGPRLAARRGLLRLDALQDEPKSSARPSRPRTRHSDGNSGSSSDKVSTEDDVHSSLPSSPQVPTRPCSAEALAQMLMSAFRKQWLPMQALSSSPGDLSLALQEFLPSSDAATAAQSLAFAEEIRQKSRMRGTLMWAPPRFQIILSIHPPKKRSEVMASQQYLCAGCGTEVEVRYMKKLRYCEYLGGYFCECCHGQAEAVIPGRVLQRWDFSLYPVCNFSKRLLDSVWFLPLFGLSSTSRTLYPRARELDKLRDLLEQLVALKKQLGACRLADGVLQEFQQLPSHLTQNPSLLSLDDLLAVKRGLLVPQARALLRAAAAHVDGCELCLANGFICEFCHSQDVIFPFQSERCKRCTECKACFHTDCFRDAGCPRCARIETRRKLMGTSALLGV
ncbi:protein RUBCNL-like [Scleropages formosus]|nr:protein RUBCNL-like [Scleropages formosus]